MPKDGMMEECFLLSVGTLVFFATRRHHDENDYFFFRVCMSVHLCFLSITSYVQVRRMCLFMQGGMNLGIETASASVRLSIRLFVLSDRGTRRHHYERMIFSFMYGAHFRSTNWNIRLCIMCVGEWF